MAVRRDGERFVVEFQQSGVRVFRRLPHAATRAQAHALETKLRRETFDRRELGRSAQITIDKAIELWLRDKLPGKKDQRNPSANARYLEPFTRGQPISQAPDVARLATNSWISGGLSTASCNRRLAVLKAAIRYAWKQGWTDQNVGGRIEMQREPPHRELYLTPAQVRKLAKAMPIEHGREAVLLLAYTGLRAGELLRAELSCSPTPCVSLSDTKSGKPRQVPVPTIAQPYLRALPLQLSYSRLQWAFRAARDAVGLPHVRIHDLRHTYASWLINRGVDLYTVGKLLGHSTPATTQRYAHLQQEALRAAVAKLK